MTEVTQKIVKKTKNLSKKLSSKQAVIMLGGKQYLVSENDEIRVEKVDRKEKTSFDIEDVLAILDGDKTIDLGQPRTTAKVKAEVLEHGKGDKIYVVKYKPKIRYKRKTGHRQQYTLIRITSIG